MRDAAPRPWPVVLSILAAGAMVAGSLLWGAERIVAVLDRPQNAPVTSVEAPPAPKLSATIADVSLSDTPFIGDPKAPAAMAYWFDYQCPFCQQVELTVMPKLIEEYVKPGKLRIYFKDFQFLGPDSMTAAIAARAVWEAAPERFYDWHRAMFEHQDNENSGWGSAEDVAALTQNVAGIDATKVEQLIKARAAEYQRAIDTALSEGSALGISGTPGTIVGAKLLSGAVPYSQFRSAIEAALASPSS